MKRLLLIVIGVCVAVGMPAAKKAKVYVDKDFHILEQPDKYGMYAKLTYTDDGINANVYNSIDMLVYKLQLAEISADTCIYNGWQEHYYFSELHDIYEYDHNELLSHTYFRDGRPIFRQPLAVGDTIWMKGGRIVFREEADSYGILKEIQANKLMAVNEYDMKTGELLAEKQYSKLDYPKITLSGRQCYYRNGKKRRLTTYNGLGEMQSEMLVDTAGKVEQQTQFMNVPTPQGGKTVIWREKKYYYPDGHLLCTKTRKGKDIVAVYYHPDGSPMDEAELPDQEDDSRYTPEIPDQMPEFKGGQKALMEFLSSNVHYPRNAPEGLQGRVVVSFMVDKDGKITDIVVVEPQHKLLNDEAVRVIQKMPKWQPGKMNGKNVRVRYFAPINFKLR